MTTVRASYSRTVGGSESADRYELGGSVTISLSEDADWAGAWEEASEALRIRVDGVIQQLNVVTPRAHDDAPIETSEVSQADDNVGESHPNDILTDLSDKKEPVEFTGCRVMFNPRYLPAEGKRREQVRMRIGDEQIPGQYVDAKGTEPAIITLMQSFRQGDFVNVRGIFEKWSKKGEDGSSIPQFDLIVDDIARV